MTAQPAPAGAPDDRSQLPDDVVLSSELAAEQRYVDRVYEQLTVATASARNVEAESRARFTSDRSDWLREESGTALFERDAFAYQAARRLAMLDAEHEGLVFGRLDLNLTTNLATSAGSVCATTTTSRWSLTGGRLPPRPSTEPPASLRWT